MTEAESTARGGRATTDATDRDPTVATVRDCLREHERHVRDAQVARARAELDLDPDEGAELTRLADRLIGRLLAGPHRALDGAEDGDCVVGTVRDLFPDD